MTGWENYMCNLYKRKIAIVQVYAQGTTNSEKNIAE